MKTIKFEGTELHGREELNSNNTASRGRPERMKSGREVNKVWEKSWSFVYPKYVEVTLLKVSHL